MLINMLNLKLSTVFSVVVVSCISFGAGNSNMTKSCVETEKQALLKFKGDFIDEGPILSTWKSEIDCCQWEGISCNKFTGHVVELSFEETSFRGNISSLCELHHLTILQLFYFDFEGTRIPKCIGSLGQLRELELGGAGLGGTIPQQLGNLSNLQTLDLESNYNLTANNLRWVSHMSSLRILSIRYVDLSAAIDWQSSLSSIVPSLSRLYIVGCGLTSHVRPQPLSHINSSTSLKSLCFVKNHLDSSILPWVSNVSKFLESINLSHNKLSGPLPMFVGLSSLKELDLSYNEFTEIHPRGFGQFYHLLVLLSLQSNKLKGVISEGHLSNLTGLTYLDVSHNLISFNISSKWILSFQPIAFYASSCILGPDFPAWLKYQKKLNILDISNGQISDSIPKWFWDMSQDFEYMNISHNSIHGPLPKSLTLTHNLGVWDLSFNKLHGPIRHFLLEVVYLFLSNNMFSGSISSVCSTSQSNSVYLDMSNNFLSGQLPNCWKQFPFLLVLNLAKNNFSGRIPHSIGTLEIIEILHLNNNKLSGEIPPFKPYSKLKFIDFGQNNLHGKLPTLIGHYLPNLIGLRLHANKLQGSLPASICSLVYLQILDLSQNNITGTIPHCLNNLTALSNITITRKILCYATMKVVPPAFFLTPYSTFWDFRPVYSTHMENAILAWKGQDVEYSKNLWLMTIIDLSCNHLSGEIPQSLTALLALASLNLSKNTLTGVIPNNMGEMKMLESLDLSCNSLSGDIPTSFSALTFLSYLNLSFNHLSGQIPQTTQLQTFNASSYIGNQGLCGLPLTQECSNPNELPRINPSIDANKDDKLISFGFYVSLVFGFIIGFWGVCGTLIFKLSWRRAYFKFFTNISDWIYVQRMVLRTRIMRRFQQ